MISQARTAWKSHRVWVPMPCCWYRLPGVNGSHSPLPANWNWSAKTQRSVSFHGQSTDRRALGLSRSVALAERHRQPLSIGGTLREIGPISGAGDAHVGASATLGRLSHFPKLVGDGNCSTGIGRLGKIEVVNHLTQTYSRREYCVQYGESDLQFVQRLMEEEGIYYFFEYTQDKHSLVLADDISGHQPVPGYETVKFRSVLPQGDDEYFTDYHASCQLGTDAWTLNDYDFQKPQSPLLVKQFAEGAEGSLTRYDFPGGYSSVDQGQHLVRIKAESQQSSREVIVMRGTVRGLRCGNLVTLAEHPIDAFNCQYLVKSQTLQVTAASVQAGDASTFDCYQSVECQTTTRPYRSPQITPRPVAYGPHWQPLQEKLVKRFGPMPTVA